MSTALITGGTGFLGEHLIRRLYGTQQIRVVARNEANLLALQACYPAVEIMPGDLADNLVAEKAVQGVDKIYHLAAFKHVGMAEEEPLQCVQSNLIATLNLLRASRVLHLRFFLAVSTDKASQVTGVYGATKFLMERLIQGFARTYVHFPYRVVRYGNVLYSTGSVLVKWRKALQEGGEITLTDPYATRFFWSGKQAVDLIERCLKEATDAQPFCPDMKSVRMGDLLDAMVKKYWKGKMPPVVNFIGLQPGENMHERVLEDGPTSEEAQKFTLDELADMV